MRCFGDPKDTIDSKQLKNQIYLLRFGHTRALLFFKKRTRNGHFPRPRETDPYVQSDSDTSPQTRSAALMPLHRPSVQSPQTSCLRLIQSPQTALHPTAPLIFFQPKLPSEAPLLHFTLQPGWVDHQQSKMHSPPNANSSLGFRLHQSGLQCTLSNSCTHQLSGIARCILYFNVLCPTISSAFAHHNTDVQMTSGGKKQTGCVFNDTVHPLWMGYRLVVSSFHPAQLPEMYFSQIFPKPIIYVHSTCMYMTCFYRVCTYRNCTHKVCVHVQSLFTTFYLSALNTFVHMIPD